MSEPDAPAREPTSGLESVRGTSLSDLLPERRDMPLMVGIVSALFVSWAGVNAAWGIADTAGTMVSKWEARLLPLEWWLGASTTALVLAAVVAGVRVRRNTAILFCVLAVYVPGTLLGWSWAEAVQWSPVAERALLVVPAAPILLVLWVWRVPFGELPLRWGSWSGPALLFQKAATTWRRKLLMALGCIVLPIAILGQIAHGFESFSSGTFWTSLLFIVSLFAVNAVVEETLFRGLFLPVLSRVVGTGSAIWLQAFFFGLHHWGSSPTVIQGVAMIVPLTLLGAVWGKATCDTHGLGWSVSVHAALGIAFFAAAPP